MSQFYVLPQNIRGASFFIDEEEASHILRVARCRAGDKIKIFDGLGHAWHALIKSVSGKSLIGEIISEISFNAANANIKLCFCVTSVSAYEDILYRCTAAGVSVFQPIISERVQGNFLKFNKPERIKKIFISACKQCERPDFPEMLPVRSLAEVVNQKDLTFIAAQGGLLIDKSLFSGKQTKNINILVGPEGGFTSEELETAKKSGVIPISLGRYVLRAEDACFYASLSIKNAVPEL